MKHNNWKQPGREIPILADLSVENCVDEMFRPFWRTEVVCPATSPPVASALLSEKTTSKRFEIVLRLLVNLWSPPKPSAPVARPPTRRVQTTVCSSESATPDRTLVPRAAAPVAPPLPHTACEELLELRAEVLNAVRTRRLQTLMLCGVDTGVGTSFIAEQLTQLLAEFAQTKVAFLTLVPHRKKKPNRRLTLASLPQLQFLLRRTERPNLVELASANGAITLTEMLYHCPTPEVLRQMKQEFDFVIIDAPAIAIYAEVADLAGLMDGVILVAEPNVTPLRRMERAHRRLNKARAKVLGMVFNRQRRR